MRASLIKTLLYLFAWLPLPVLHVIGQLVGWILILFPNRLKHIATRNIRLCLPELEPSGQAQLVRRSLLETGKTALEMGKLWLRPAGHVLGLVRKVHGIEHVEAARSKGRGVILATPHLGAWEVAGLYCAHAFDITCLYRPLRISGLEQLVNKARSRAGGRYVPANARGIRLLYRTLEVGGVVAMLPDQEPLAGTGVFAPFFGIPAFSMVFLSRLAIRDNTPVVFVWCERLGMGRGYHLHFMPAPDTVYSKDTVTSVGGVNNAVEQAIRKCPQQYQWSYRRFRTRPDGQPSLYRQSG